MADRVDVSELKPTNFLGGFLLQVMMKHADKSAEGKAPSIFSVPGWQHLRDLPSLQVLMEIEGVKVSCLDSMMEMEKEAKESVDVEVEKRIKERAGLMFEKIASLEASVLRSFKDEIGVSPKEQDDKQDLELDKIQELLVNILPVLKQAAAKWGDYATSDRLTEVQERLQNALSDMS